MKIYASIEGDLDLIKLNMKLADLIVQGRFPLAMTIFWASEKLRPEWLN